MSACEKDNDAAWPPWSLDWEIWQQQLQNELRIDTCKRQRELEPCGHKQKANDEKKKKKNQHKRC